jgi:3-hydroxybutyryl-CoA dehydrogenase
MTELTGVAAVGAGRMGRGIALSCAIAGVESVLIDLKPRAAEDFARFEAQARAEVERDLGFLARIGVLHHERVPALTATVRVLPAAEAAGTLSGCDLIFQGVPETIDAKRVAFDWINEAAPADMIVASTTSTMGVNELAAMIARPQRFLNAHWLNPAHLMPLVEISVGSRTDPEVAKRTRAILTSLGKVPVVCSAPRVQALAMNEAARLVEEGVASVEDIDTAVRVGFGLRFAVLGLLEFIDWGGNDILYYATGQLSRTIDAERFRAPPIIESNMCATNNRDDLKTGERSVVDQSADVHCAR